MEELRARLFWDIPLNHKILHIFSLLQLLPGSLGFSILPLTGLQSLMVPKAPATKALITWLQTRPICLNRGFRELSSQATCWLAPSWGHHLQNCSTIVMLLNCGVAFTERQGLCVRVCVCFFPTAVEAEVQEHGMGRLGLSWKNSSWSAGRPPACFVLMWFCA